MIFVNFCQLHDYLNGAWLPLSCRILPQGLLTATKAWNQLTPDGRSILRRSILLIECQKNAILLGRRTSFIRIEIDLGHTFIPTAIRAVLIYQNPFHTDLSRMNDRLQYCTKIQLDIHMLVRVT